MAVVAGFVVTVGIIRLANPVDTTTNQSAQSGTDRRAASLIPINASDAEKSSESGESKTASSSGTAAPSKNTSSSSWVAPAPAPATSGSSSQPASTAPSNQGSTQTPQQTASTPAPTPATEPSQPEAEDCTIGLAGLICI